MSRKKLKKAIKTIKFWYNVLLTTNLMNEPNNRTEMFEAIEFVEKKVNQKPLS